MKKIFVYSSSPAYLLLQQERSMRHKLRKQPNQPQQSEP